MGLTRRTVVGMNSSRTDTTEVDLHRLDLRFEAMRIVDPASLRQLLRSLEAYPNFGAT